MSESKQPPKSHVTGPEDPDERQHAEALIAARPWYRTEIGPRLKPSVREFYKNYVKLEGKELLDHLYAIVSSSVST